MAKCVLGLAILLVFGSTGGLIAVLILKSLLEVQRG